MRTHVESIWVEPWDIIRASSSNSHGYVLDATLTAREAAVSEGEVEFVPAAAYRELKAQLVEAWSACYVAGQGCAKDGVPRRNPFSVMEKASET